jgi:hypothetical protein
MLGADLMPKPSGTGMDHGRHLSLPEAESRGGILVDYPVYHLQFKKVITRTKGTECCRATFECAFTNISLRAL